MLLVAKAACDFWSKCVSLQLVLQGASDPSAFKTFLPRCFVVHSTCYIDI